MHMPTLIFDIETVPDYTLWSPPKTEAPAAPPAPTNPNNALPGQLAIVPAGVTSISSAAAAPIAFDIPAAGPKKRASRAKKPAVNPDGTPVPTEEPMPPLFACRPVAIGYVVLSDDLMVSAMGAVGTSTHGNDEPRLLRDLGSFVQSLEDPHIVTFNGRTFDMPVLAFRAFKHGVQHTWYTRDHQHRYNSEKHLDLFDALTEHGAVQRKGYGLDAIGAIIGLPGKGEFDGSKVHGLHKAGEHAKIEGYCLADAVKTAFVFLRYQLMRGRIPDLIYKQAAGYLLDVCKQRKMEGVIFGCDPKRLLLEE